MHGKILHDFRQYSPRLSVCDRLPPVLNLLKPFACQPSVALRFFCLFACPNKFGPLIRKNPPQLSLRGFVVSPGIEPGSGASETLILSIVLRDQSWVQM